ncbi:Threonylcarbamoyl-AMP synthase [Anthophora plagiata]
MWSQLARLIKCHSSTIEQRAYLRLQSMGPMTAFLDGALNEVETLKNFSSHYICKGRRSIALAATLLRQDHLPEELLTNILPGPYTIILKRTQNLNPAFNPNHDTVGIRIPKFSFINCVADIVGPLALTSANEVEK